MKVSLHHHTKYSGDKYLQEITPKKVINKAFDKKIDVLIITDSNEDRTIDYVLEDKSIKNKHKLNNQITLIEKENKKLYLIRGMEYRKKGGHILLIGQNESLKDKLLTKEYSFKDIQKIVHDKEGMFILAHPFNPFYVGVKNKELEELVFTFNKEKGEYVDALEWNASNITFIPFTKFDFKKYNHKTNEFCREWGITMVPGDDSHNLMQIGRSYFKISYYPSTGLVNHLKNSIKYSNKITPTYRYQTLSSFFRYNPNAIKSRIKFVL